MKERLIHLLDKQLAGTLTRHERSELMGLVLEPSLQDDLQTFMNTAWEKTGETHSMSDERTEELFRLIAEGKTVDEDNNKVIDIQPERRHRIGWKRWMAAASILLLIGLGAYFLVSERSKKTTDDPITMESKVEAPKINKAIITLVDGRTIQLDSIGTGEIALQGNIKLIKLANGQITYSAGESSEQTAELYNTLTNPRGSKVIDMMLADGSHVWLNAGSSVTYPVAFTGNTRKVTIDGEAYFEIAKDESRPFIVSKGKTSVTVLGTHFNVNAYDDEDNIKVTLLEGSVKVSSEWLEASGKETILKPGQQAIVNPSSVIIVNTNVNMDAVMAWKNGYFHFVHADVPAVMRELARWYDLEISYEGNIPKREFGGEMQRDLPLSSVLRLLEKSNIRLRIDGRKLTVLP